MDESKGNHANREKISEPVCLDDFEENAALVLPQMVLDYYRSGAGRENTLKWNKLAFDKYSLRPRVLRNVAEYDLSTTVLGRRIDIPIGLSPLAMQCMAHSDGEKGTVRAATAAGTCMILSTLSTTSMEEVSAAGGQKAHLWFQLYTYKDRALTQEMVKRAEAAGYSALVVTVDAAAWGTRLNDARNKFVLPPHLKLGNFSEAGAEGRMESQGGSGLAEYVTSLFDSSLNWDGIDWLMSLTTLPIILKGILTGEDAKIAAKRGVAGIMVSNHGARQLDTVPATIDVLAEVVAATAPWPKCEIYMDGGVRTGTDVLKALILGARAVFIARPIVWALAHSGEEGVAKALSLLKEEFRVALQLIGASCVRELEPDMVKLYRP